MKPTLYLESFAALLPEGIRTPAGLTPWREDQDGPQTVTREQVLDKPYLSFGKLSLPDKLAFSVASLVLSSYPVENKDSFGISLGLPAGSLSTDLRYMESVIAGFPSPAIFSATLPSSAIADIAIFFGLKSENRVIAGGAESGLVALECAQSVLSSGAAHSMLVVSVNAVEQRDFFSPLLPPDIARENHAYALLLTDEKRLGGLGYTFSATFEPLHKDLPPGGGELYFYELITLALAGGGSVECNAGDVFARITVSKTQ